MSNWAGHRKRLTLRLPLGMYAWLLKMADETGFTVNDLLIDAVRQYVYNNENIETATTVVASPIRSKLQNQALLGKRDQDDPKDTTAQS